MARMRAISWAERPARRALGSGVVGAEGGIGRTVAGGRRRARSMGLAGPTSAWQDPGVRRPSTAQQLADAERQRVAALSPSERVVLTLEPGRRDLELFARARGLSLAEAPRPRARAPGQSPAVSLHRGADRVSDLRDVGARNGTRCRP
jgi:hypothetical protein